MPCPAVTSASQSQAALLHLIRSISAKIKVLNEALAKKKYPKMVYAVASLRLGLFPFIPPFLYCILY